MSTRSSVVLALAGWLALGWAGGSGATVLAPVVVPPLFGDHMVLQRDCRVPVWGTAGAGEIVTVAIAGRTARARAGADGRWSVRLDPLRAGGPYELRVWAHDTLAFHDVLVGEVWLASGQSNMEMPLDGWARVNDADAEVAAADLPRLRLFTVGRRIATTPGRVIASDGWQPCTPAAVRGFSATAYFFGRAIHRELGVPVGLIHASWGGTIVETWTSAGALRRVPEMEPRLGRIAARAAAGSDDPARQDYRRALAAWLAAVPGRDRGSNATPPWSAARLEGGGWKAMTLPCDWENAGLADLDGVVWFRREVEVPSAWAGRALALGLGRIDDADSTWFDGEPVGADSVWNRPRVYRVPARLATPGRHTIAVRVYDWGGGGGLWGDPWMMRLAPAMADPGAPAPPDSLALAGAWVYRIGLDLRELGPRPQDPDDPNQPTLLSNGMIEPLVPYAIRGAIWYQGEGNADRAHQYRRLFPLLIEDWRARWGEGAFPFLYVQLAGWQEPPREPGESDWAELREAQAMALRLPHTGMAVAVDIGDARDIHPRDKQEVGRRLALQALRKVYGRDVVADGPRFRSMRLDGGRARLRFVDAAGGLQARGGGAPRGFAVAGADRVFHWAEARVQGGEVVVWCDAVPRPVAVRYGWAANPGCDLVDGAGLPAVPFRTDVWPGVTDGRK